MGSEMCIRDSTLPINIATISVFRSFLIIISSSTPLFYYNESHIKRFSIHKRIAIFEEGHDVGKASWVVRVVEVVEMHFSYCLPSYH